MFRKLSKKKKITESIKEDVSVSENVINNIQPLKVKDYIKIIYHSIKIDLPDSITKITSISEDYFHLNNSKTNMVSRCYETEKPELIHKATDDEIKEYLIKIAKTKKYEEGFIPLDIQIESQNVSEYEYLSDIDVLLYKQKPIYQDLKWALSLGLYEIPEKILIKSDGDSLAMIIHNGKSILKYNKFNNWFDCFSVKSLAAANFIESDNLYLQQVNFEDIKSGDIFMKIDENHKYPDYSDYYDKVPLSMYMSNYNIMIDKNTHISLTPQGFIPDCDNAMLDKNKTEIFYKVIKK